MREPRQPCHHLLLRPHRLLWAPPWAPAALKVQKLCRWVLLLFPFPPSLPLFFPSSFPPSYISVTLGFACLQLKKILSHIWTSHSLFSLPGIVLSCVLQACSPRLQVSACLPHLSPSSPTPPRTSRLENNLLSSHLHVCLFIFHLRQNISSMRAGSIAWQRTGVQ